MLLCAHNPTEFGDNKARWRNYPTLTACIEMCITNQFMFPPPTTPVEKIDDMKNTELQVATLERQSILDFEIHLAAATNKATITESNSLLLTQLINMDPAGPYRRPPQHFLDQLQQVRSNTLTCVSRILVLWN